VGNVWLRPSPDHLLGTDQIGRDIFTRLLYAPRNTIALGFVITILPFIVGIICDFTAATLKGWMDQVLSGTVDIMMAFPSLIFALMILLTVGTSIVAMILVIALLDSTRVYRLPRAVAMDIEVMEYNRRLVSVHRQRTERLNDQFY